MVQGIKSRKKGGYGPSGTLFWFLKECSVMLFMSVTLAEEKFRKWAQQYRHNVLQQTADGTGISSALRKGRVFKHFGSTDNMALVSQLPKKSGSCYPQRFMAMRQPAQNGIKPDIVLHYNRAKGALTTGDQMAGEHSCIRGTKRTAFRLFVEMVNRAAFNAYVLWAKKKKSYFSNIRNGRKLFLRELAIKLAKPNVLVRKNSNSGHHRHVFAPTDLFLGHMSELTPTSWVFTV